MTLYIGALVFGGVLLGSSILLGGHDDADVEGDATGDLHGDPHASDGALDKDLPADEASSADGDGLGVLWVLRSLRFWTFFFAFFGLTGVLLDGLGLVASEWVSLALSGGMGLLIGGGAATILRALARDETAHAADERDYVGKSASVLVPIKKGSVGKVRVEVKGQLVDLLAEADEDIDAKGEVLIVEMEGARARVARMDEDS